MDLLMLVLAEGRSRTAGLGTAQLILLCHLMTTRYRVQWENSEAVRMALVSVPLPRNFRGTIARHDRE
jgi:hypothetical protein